MVVRALVCVIAVGLAACLVFGFLSFRLTPAVYFEEFELEHQSLEAIDAVLWPDFAPETSDLAIGVSGDALSDALKVLVGASATTAFAGGLTLSVQNVHLDVRNGYVPVELSVRVMRMGVEAEATLTAKGVLFADRLEAGIGHADSKMHYRVVVREVGGTLTTGRLSLATRNWLNRVIASNVGQKFVESLTFSVPVQMPVDLNVSFSEKITSVKDEGSFTMRYWLEAPGFIESRSIRAAPAIPANGAVWFLASVVHDEDARNMDNVGVTTAVQEVEDLEASVLERLASFPKMESDVAVFLNRSFLEKVVDAFNGLADEHRTIRVELESYRGHLAKSYKDVRIVGEGGYSLRFVSTDSLRGAARLSQLSSHWVDNKGMVLAGHVDVEAQATLRLHIDPYVSGGFNTDVDLAARARVPVSVGLEPKLIQGADGTAILIGPAVRCQRFPLRLEETNAGLGVITDQFIGRSQATPWSIIGPFTLWHELIERAPDGEFTFDSEYWIGVRLVPTSVISGANGYRVLANMEWELATEKPESQSKSFGPFEEIWHDLVRSDCPEERGVTFLLAGAEFGPNNELVKAVEVLVGAFDQAGAVVEVSWERTMRVLRDPREAPKVVEETLADLAGELKSGAERLESAVKEFVEFIVNPDDWW